MTKHTLTRRELARQALTAAGGALLAFPASSARSQAVDQTPAAPPPLPTSPLMPAPVAPAPAQKIMPMPATPEATPGTTEGELLTQLVPVAAGYTLSDSQAKEAALQLKDYPGGFAKARAYALPDDIGPAFAALAPVRKERVK